MATKSISTELDAIQKLTEAAKAHGAAVDAAFASRLAALGQPARRSS